MATATPGSITRLRSSSLGDREVEGESGTALGGGGGFSRFSHWEAEMVRFFAGGGGGGLRATESSRCVGGSFGGYGGNGGGGGKGGKAGNGTLWRGRRTGKGSSGG